jgi:putative ABC transport system permease protein
MPSFGEVLKAKLLNMSHVEHIRRELRDEIEAAAPAVYRQYSASFSGCPLWKMSTVIGTTAEFSRMLHLKMKGGQFLGKDDVAENRRVCVMDSSLVNDIFTGDDPIGRELEIARGMATLRLKVIGVLEDPFKLRRPHGQLDTAAMSRSIFASRLEFKNIYVPLGLVWEEEDSLGTILLRARDTDTVERAMAKLSHCFPPEQSFVGVFAQKEWILETLRSVHDFTGYSNVIWIVMVGVAAVMIMTIRLVCVRERYREIAIRRTEGASRGTIALQFALEGILLCATGGVMGIGLGIALAKLVEASIIRWEVIFSASSILLAAVLSVAVGILSGILPARRAASLDPVEALRMP